MVGQSEAVKKPIILTPLLQILLLLQVLSALVVVVEIFYSGGQKIFLPPGIYELYEFTRRSVQFWPWLVLVVNMFWIYRISKNTHILSSQQLEFSPGWAVGWFFVPFASFWQPYRVVTELYKANGHPLDWKERPQPLVVSLWWFITLGGTLVSVGAMFARIGGVSIPVWLSTVVLVALALHQTLALTIYSRIADWQQKARPISQTADIF